MTEREFRTEDGSGSRPTEPGLHLQEAWRWRHEGSSAAAASPLALPPLPLAPAAEPSTLGPSARHVPTLPCWGSVLTLQARAQADRHGANCALRSISDTRTVEAEPCSAPRGGRSPALSLLGCGPDPGART